MALADFKNSIITQDKFSTTFNKFDRSVQGSARGLDKLGGVLSSGSLGMLFGGVAGVAGAAAIGKVVWSLGELGAQSLTTKASFESLMQSVGQSSGLLDQLKTAAGGTITEMQLMQQANVALAGSSGQLATEMAAALPRLLEAGRAAALLNPAMGDANFMFQSLVTGIKRGSPMLIDNTGITLKLGEATEAYAKSIGKSVSELTAQERSIAILRATLDSSSTLIQQVGGDLNSMTSDIQSAKVAVQELKMAFAEMAAPGVASIAKGLATEFQVLAAIMNNDAIGKASAELKRAESEVATLTKQLQDLEGSTQRGADGLRKQLTRELEKAKTEASGLTAEIQRLTAIEIGFANASEGARFATRNFGAAIDDTSRSVRTATVSVEQMAQRLPFLAAAYGPVIAAARAMRAEMGTRAFLGGADVLSQSQYTSLTQGRINLERGLAIQVKAGMITQAQADYQLQRFDNTVNDHISSLRKVDTATGNYASTVDDLKGRIAGALTPTFDLSGLTGGLLGQMGGDTFDEAYKRLAAVALRPEELQIHAGDWADTFEKAGLTGLTPEEAQQRARELVEAYSKGLDFSLIDREMIKDNVRQAIKAEEIYNTIVDEIYAEMGKENTKLQSAGTRLGDQLNKATTARVKSGAADYVGAWLDVLEPELIRRLDARGRRTGQVQ